MVVLYILLAIVILLLMVLIHEFGHYIAGKLLKFKITEFSIGFGFPIFSHKSKKTGEKFSLRIFPLGGYCAFDGEDDTDESPSSFNAQKPWKRIIVFLAGVTANFLTAIIFSWILLCSIGYDVPQIASFNKSYQNPYQVGDVIVAVEDHWIDFAFGDNYSTVVNAQRKLAFDAYKAKIEKGEDVENFTDEQLEHFTMTVKRDGKEVDLEILVYPHFEVKDGKQVLSNVFIGLETEEGQTPHTKAYVFGVWEGFCRSFEMAVGFAWVVLKSLWLFLTNITNVEILKQMGGTVTTITMIADYAQQSMSFLLVLIPAIAANLAVFNILPLPALDGSHVLFTLIEWIRGKPINRKVESIIHLVGICVLFAFVIIIDILHFVL